jgi:solute carrier family 44 protein 1 (choline transporter-like protein)
MDGNCTRAQKRPTEYISISSKWRDAVCNGVQHHRHNLGVAVFRGVSIHDAGRKRRSVVFQKVQNIYNLGRNILTLEIFRNQANSPIVVSFTNTMRFHLGTIALGSFIITLMALIRAVIRSLINNNKLKWLCDCCCGNLEALLKFLSKNSYIETAIHGQSFFRSGKRAAKQLITNAGSVIALNSVGDFVMVMTQFILVAISTAIAYALFLDSPNNLLLPTVISFILNLIIVVIIFGVFGTTVDTLFICFCEDKSINDGTTKPYYMSKGLMQFVENSKKFYKEN